MTPITELEAAAADGWRAPEEAALGDWRLRAAEGFTGRANSASPSRPGIRGAPGSPRCSHSSRVPPRTSSTRTISAG
jgi:hypothetical protein